MASNHTAAILKPTIRLVDVCLVRKGFRMPRYRPNEMKHMCIMLAEQASTSHVTYTLHHTTPNGQYPATFNTVLSSQAIFHQTQKYDIRRSYNSLYQKRKRLKFGFWTFVKFAHSVNFLERFRFHSPPYFNRKIYYQPDTRNNRGTGSIVFQITTRPTRITLISPPLVNDVSYIGENELLEREERRKKRAFNISTFYII